MMYLLIHLVWMGEDKVCVFNTQIVLPGKISQGSFNFTSNIFEKMNGD